MVECFKKHIITIIAASLIIVAIAVTVSVLVIKIKDENKNVPTTDETLSILKKIMRFKGQILNWI